MLTSSLQRGKVLAQPFTSYLACARYYITSEIQLQVSSEEKSAYEKNWFWEFQIRSDQSLSRVWLFATPWIAARQASQAITNSQSSLRLTSIESVMPSSHLILCRPLLLLPPISPSIRVFSNESTLRIKWPKYWSFSFSIIPSKEIPGLIEGSLENTYTSQHDALHKVSE